MPIQILEIQQRYSDKIFATVRHCNYIFNAYVVDNRQDFSGIIGQDVVVEIDYEKLNSWRRVKNYQDDTSCICKGETDSNLIVRGRIHNLITTDNDTAIIDIYLRNGPEFIVVESNELNGEILDIGEGIEIEVSGLHFFPVHP